MRTNTKSPQRRGTRKGSNQITVSSGQTITERPILFQTEMVKAILEGRKTQTRRTKGFTNENPEEWDLEVVRSFPVSKFDPAYFGAFFRQKLYPNKTELIKSQYGKPGDLLWVRETWQHTRVLNINPQDENFGYVYKADDQPWADYEGWIYKPSIHMPKDAARLWLMIEDIRVERVQEISEEDSIAEGIYPYLCPINGVDILGYKNYEHKMMPCPPKRSFQSLWTSINGEESWSANPWVWVVKFRVLSTTGKPSEEIIQKNLSDLCASAVNERKEVSNV